MPDLLRRPTPWLPLLAMAALLAACGDAGEPDLEVGAARAGTPAGGASQVAVQIDNHGDGNDELVAASTPAAAEVELHLTEIDGGQASMTELDGVDVPAGGSVAFRPGELHLMMVLPDETVIEGATFDLTLQFDRSGERSVEVEVVPIANLLDDPIAE